MHWQPGLRATKLLLFWGLPSLVATAVAAGDFAYITNQNSSDLSILDLHARGEVARIDIAGKPAGIAVHSETGHYFTVSPGSKTLRKLSLAENKVLDSVVLDGGPIGVVAAPDGKRVFVSDWYNARIWVVDAERMTVMSQLHTGGNPAGLAISADGRWLASADREADQVSLFDLRTLTLHRTVNVGIRPFGISFDPEDRVFVGNVGSNDVTVIDPALGRVIATIKVGERPYGIAFAQGKGFVTNQYSDTVSALNLDDLSHVATIEVGEYPEGIDVTADGQTLVVANWFSNSVSLIDATTLEVVGEITTGDGPRAFGRFIGSAPKRE